MAQQLTQPPFSMAEIEQDLVFARAACAGAAADGGGGGGGGCSSSSSGGGGGAAKASCGEAIATVLAKTLINAQATQGLTPVGAP